MAPGEDVEEVAVLEVEDEDGRQEARHNERLPASPSSECQDVTVYTVQMRVRGNSY